MCYGRVHVHNRISASVYVSDPMYASVRIHVRDRVRVHFPVRVHARGVTVSVSVYFYCTSTGGEVPALVALVPALVALVPALVAQCVKGLLPW
jgi:hypothetical protein